MINSPKTHSSYEKKQPTLVRDRNELIQSNFHPYNALNLERTNPELPEFMGESQVIKNFVASIQKVANSKSRVLILGESGTGKELAAQWIHRQSTQSDQPFVAVNCAAIPTELIESELFGHEKGAFTGALERKVGRFEQAESGTLFLDEVGDLSLRAQAKLLRALQENYFYRVGGTKPVPFKARVVSATNQHLLQAVNKKTFRHDLYYRLAIIILHLPALSERREDIPQLAEVYLHKLIDTHEVDSCSFTKGALHALQCLDWPGNVRQLQNVVERLALLTEGPQITKAHVSSHIEPDEHYIWGVNFKVMELADSIQDFLKKSATLREFKTQSEAWFLETKLYQHQWNVALTARELGMTRSALYAKINQYSLPLNRG